MANIVEVKVPDIGDFKDVPIIEMLVKVGDQVKAEDPLITIESDKATVDVPSPVSGVITELKLKVGDTVSEGTLIGLIDSAAAAGGVDAGATVVAAVAVAGTPAVTRAATPAEPAQTAAPVAAGVDFRPGHAEQIPAPHRLAMPTATDRLQGQTAHASPSVRRFARELGVDVARVKGSGPKGRILQGDVQAYVKGIVAAAEAPAAAGASVAASAGGLDLLPWPKIDFAKFGPIETQPLSRIKKISGANLSRNWVMIPAVTYHEDADITDLEAFRVQINKENEKAGGAKLTMLAFLIKACVKAMQKYPEFNSSIDGDNLVLKQYWHIGFAADTPNGLVVPVLKDADKKSIADLSKELGDLAEKTRTRKIAPDDLKGGTFTISNLGGIGGTFFTPIVNLPEVAILALGKGVLKPVVKTTEKSEKIVARTMLPIGVSYDHRVIDGADGARFIRTLVESIEGLTEKELGL